jgi:alcohol dehydrogenase class IV
VTELRLTYPRRIIFGWGALRLLPEEARLLGRRPLVVIGRNWLRTSGRLDPILDQLRSAGLQPELFEGVEPEPTVATAQRVTEVLRSGGRDSVIALGGGSVIDVAKAAAALAPLEGTAGDYFSGREVPSPGLPCLAAPSTAGTGAEATKNSVLLDPQRKLKASLRSEHLMPSVAIVDPELTLDLPPAPTAHCGLDALCQAIESYTSLGASPATDGLSLRAAGLVASNLLNAYRSGDSRPAREAVSLGSLLAGIALNNARLGLVHGLAHPLGARCDLPHGLVCAILLPAVTEFNRQACPDKYRQLELELQVAEGQLPAHLRRLNTEMQIPPRLSQLGVAPGKHELEAIVAETMPSGSTKSNPRPASPAEVEQLLFSLL